MDAVRFCRQSRALRLRKDLRQLDVSRIAKLSRSLISRIDRGKIENIQLGQLERAAAALGATVDLRLRWHGEQLDRLLDEARARVVEVVVSALRAGGWEIAVEVSFSIWGERGSIDVFAFHPLAGMVLVVEVKSVVPDSQQTLHALDRKTRLRRSLRKTAGGTAGASPDYSSWPIRRHRAVGSRESGPRTRPPCRSAVSTYGAG